MIKEQPADNTQQNKVICQGQGWALSCCTSLVRAGYVQTEGNVPLFWMSRHFGF